VRALGTIVYGLADPRTGQVRYVGKTVKSLETRVREHLQDSRYQHNHRSHWLRKLSLLELAPTSFILEVVPPTIRWQEREQWWIAFYRAIGLPLVNGTDGGEGLENPVASVRAKISDWNRDRVLSEETKAKIAQGNRNNKNSAGKRSESCRTKLAIFNQRPLSDETRAKLRVAVARRREQLRLGALRQWAYGNIGRKSQSAV
jgi:hypothetical protein